MSASPAGFQDRGSRGIFHNRLLTVPETVKHRDALTFIHQPDSLGGTIASHKEP